MQIPAMFPNVHTADTKSHKIPFDQYRGYNCYCPNIQTYDNVEHAGMLLIYGRRQF
jgi:hypothetical protein